MRPIYIDGAYRYPADTAFYIFSQQIYIYWIFWHMLHNVGFLSSTKVKVKFTLEQAMKAQRGSRGIAVLFR
jgi:hypothetical protein